MLNAHNLMDDCYDVSKGGRGGDEADAIGDSFVRREVLGLPGYLDGSEMRYGNEAKNFEKFFDAAVVAPVLDRSPLPGATELTAAVITLRAVALQALARSEDAEKTKSLSFAGLSASQRKVDQRMTAAVAARLKI